MAQCMLLERFRMSTQQVLAFYVFILSSYTSVYLVQTSTLLFDYVIPRNCSISASAYFDPVNLKCLPCNNGTVASEDRLRCICRPGSIQASDGSCQKCTQGTKASEDRAFCIRCSSSTETDQCPSCPSRHFKKRSVSDGGILTSEECTKCPESTKVSDHGDTCVPCLQTDQSCECRGDKSCQKIEENEMLTTIQLENGSQKSSSYIARNIRQAVQGCSRNDVQACQHLANMCVLQNYRTEQLSACTEFEKITSADPYKQWSNRLPVSPTLFYYNSEPSVELSREAAIPASFSFDTRQPNSFLEVILVQFTLNGTFFGTVPLSESNLNACSQQKNKFRFGAFHQMRCSIQLQWLLRLSGAEPTFSDLYIVFLNEYGKKQLYAVPILDENVRRNGQFVNRLTPDELSNSKWILTRRLYFVDRISLGDSSATALNSTVIRFPEEISIRVQIQPQKEGRIMPPYVRIRHAEVTTWNPEEHVALQFEIAYFADGSKFFRDIEIILYVLAALSVVYAAISAYSWGRRSGKMIIDGATAIKLILFECDILSDVFLFVVLASALFVTFTYKAQQLPYFVVLNSKQERTLISYLLVATILKSVSLLHRTAHLILTKTFFVDWERPHVIVETGTTAPESADIRQSAVTTPPVIWRTYLVANEWNELQNYRKTSVSIQMITMLALLQWLKLEKWAAVAPGFHTDPPVEYASTIVTRLAITTTFYLAISMSQWIFHVVVMERLIQDPFHNMIDLCSIANISVFALTHPLHGYYIHGRSVHGQADTDMSKMNQYLHKEKENLCGERGLEPGSELQTYIINLPKAFREQFEAAGCSARQQLLGTGFDATTANIQRIAKAHEELNRFLMEFIEHSNPQADYIIRDASLLEFLLDIEFVDTLQTGNFIRDKSEMAYSGAFMYGNEWVYLSFELLLFISVDIFTESYPCSAFVTYTASMAMRKIASLLFTNHLINSSFVDQRFLL